MTHLLTTKAICLHGKRKVVDQDAAEVARKTQLWDGMNKEYLERRAARQVS